MLRSGIETTLLTGPPDPFQRSPVKLPVDTSQRATVPSLQPAANVPPSGLNALVMTLLFTATQSVTVAYKMESNLPPSELKTFREASREDSPTGICVTTSQSVSFFFSVVYVRIFLPSPRLPSRLPTIARETVVGTSKDPIGIFVPGTRTHRSTLIKCLLFSFAHVWQPRSF